MINVDVDLDLLAEAIAARLTVITGPTLPEDFLDVDGAAALLASTPSAIRSLVKRDAIPHYKAPNGRLLFDRDHLRQWVTSGRGA